MDFTGVTDVYTTGGAFMALNKNTGKAQCWGSSNHGSRCSDLDFTGTTDVYSTGSAFMALNKNTGQAQCWGRGDAGGDCRGMDFAGVTDVYARGGDLAFMPPSGSRMRFAFMALNKNTGQAQCWGRDAEGGDCSGLDLADW